MTGVQLELPFGPPGVRVLQPPAPTCEPSALEALESALRVAEQYGLASCAVALVLPDGRVATGWGGQDYGFALLGGITHIQVSLAGVVGGVDE